MRTTWLPTSMPNSFSRRRATEQQATRMAVSRALDRSMTGRMSSCSLPARSAWPGRGIVTFSMSSGGSPSMAIFSGQPALSFS